MSHLCRLSVQGEPGSWTGYGETFDEAIENARQAQAEDPQHFVTRRMVQRAEEEGGVFVQAEGGTVSAPEQEVGHLKAADIPVDYIQVERNRRFSTERTSAYNRVSRRQVEQAAKR